MNVHWKAFFLCLALGLVACTGAEATPEMTVTVPAAATTTVTPVATVVASPTASIIATEPATASPPPTAIRPLDLSNLDWEDRTLFRAALIPGEQDVLAEMPGATIYHISFTIADDMTHLTGQEEVYYTNREEVPLDAVYFRLFPNLAAGSSAIGAAEVNGEPVAVTLEQVNSAARVPLSPPLEPGQSVEISLTFEVTVPDEQGGNYGEFIFDNGILTLAHFYPMVAVYDDEGWNIEIPSPAGDIVYADASFYVVQVRAPAAVKLVASGVAMERIQAGDEQIVTYVMGPARDFYLAGSEHFRVVTGSTGETTVNSYAFAEHEAAAQEVLTYAIAALEIFGQRFGTFPYTELDIASTPTIALGIEYPGVIVDTQRFYEDFPPAGGTRLLTALESTTAHEVAHQWYYAVIGNDQLDEPWLDESMAQYATWLYFVDRYGENQADAFFESLLARSQAVEDTDQPIGLPVSAYTTQEYSAIVYGRGPVFVRTLAETMGEATFEGFLREYYSQFQWEIATTAGYQALAELECDCDLGPLFDTWVYPP